ncbi:MAG TPA: hypothetical protein ENJ87_01685 [Gammaproteobacteria bacterium]|nr:hypothetical protein [Gammaproteobacteria bacterium]
MRGMVPPDPESRSSNLEYAVIYVPKRSRNRFAASCVEVKSCAADALDAADPQNKYYAARVSGPSKSSEGQYIYYLIEWLT